ncbi:MAG: rhodanese-related sulfurtransferase [Chlamydiales bacterium]
MSQIEITLEMTMDQVLERAPAAQRALFQRYHVGGCSSCGFQPSDTLAQVAKDHNILDTTEMVETIVRAQDVDSRVQVEPTAVKGWIDAGEDFSFIDVRTPEEWEQARIAQAELLDYNQSEKYMGLPKDHKIVFSCHTGVRSLDVASYFIGHGFTEVYSMRGGISAWSDEIDPAVPKY